MFKKEQILAQRIKEIEKKMKGPLSIDVLLSGKRKKNPFESGNACEKPPR